MTDQLVAAIRSRPEPPARTEPRAGGTGRDGLTAMQQEVLAAAPQAWESLSEVASRCEGRSRNVVRQAVQVLVKRGLEDQDA